MSKQIITHVCCQCDQFFDIIDPVDAVRICPFCGSEEQTPYSHQELSKSGIPWRKYDPTDRSIESHVQHLITDGITTWTAYHVKRIGSSDYRWYDDENELMSLPITHWSPINLPGEEEAPGGHLLEGRDEA